VSDELVSRKVEVESVSTFYIPD